MELSILPRKPWPVLPLLALGLVLYLNIINRCADGYCYTHGWPWVAYYGWSDAGSLDGGPVPHRLEWGPALADAIVCAIILAGSLLAHRWWSRQRAG